MNIAHFSEPYLSSVNFPVFPHTLSCLLIFHLDFRVTWLQILSTRMFILLILCRASGHIQVKGDDLQYESQNIVGS